MPALLLLHLTELRLTEDLTSIRGGKKKRLGTDNPEQGETFPLNSSKLSGLAEICSKLGKPGKQQKIQAKDPAGILLYPTVGGSISRAIICTRAK